MRRGDKSLASGRLKPSFPFKIRPESQGDRYSVFEVRFPSALPSGIKANDEVWGHLYLPDGLKPGERPPCVIVLPIMAGPNLWIESKFAESFAQRRMAAFVLEMPFQFHRRPNPLIPNGEVFLARTPKRMRRNFQESVADVRRAITWVADSGKADPQRLAIFGISLGAIVASSVYSQETRLKAGIFLLGGADIAHILAHSTEVEDIYPHLNVSDAELEKTFIGIDPMQYREANRGKRALLINALWDAVIPRVDARKLARSFPNCRQIWVPFGHYSAMIHMIWIRPFVAGKLRSWLGA